jgi:hypothetical protein
MAQEVTTLRERVVSRPRQEVINEAKRLFQNCLVTSKSHFVEARFWQNLHLWIGIPTVILAAVAGTLAFAEVKLIAGILSMVIVVLTSITTFLNPKEQGNSHFAAANNYDALMTRIRIFRSIDCWSDESDDLLTDRLMGFCDERDKLNRECPQPFKWSYRVAKRGIQEGEAEYFIDKQIGASGADSEVVQQPARVDARSDAPI